MTTIEKIRAEIERRMFEDYNGPDAEQNETAQGVCAGILAFLDTLKETPTWVNRAEQRRKDQANGKKFAIMEIRAELDKRYAEYSAKMETDDLIYYEGMADALDLFEQFLDTLPEQPVEGLEEEIKRYLRDECSSDDEPSVSETARHFYDLGCRHTAVMYDDIEYERQRAEEAELSGDLEEEIDRYWKEEMPVVTESDLNDIARHFAEWGAEHLKK